MRATEPFLRRENNISMKLETALGFCAKAGKIKAGEFAVERAVAKRQARAVILDTCVSENTDKKWSGVCESKKLPLYKLADIGRLVGKRDNMVFAVTDDTFHALIKEALEDAGCKKTDTYTGG